MIQKTLPHAIIDRQELRVTFDGEELPYYYAEQGRRVEELGEGLSLVWLPIIVEGVEEIPAEPSEYRSPDLWPAQEVVEKGGRVLESYRGDS